MTETKISAGDPHPFRWYVPDNAETLIIGTFPPVQKRWAFEFFYPNKRNLFWTMMAEIAGTTLSTDSTDPVDDRKRLLSRLRVGVTDMGGIIKRIKENSLDENLEIVEYMPILEILKSYPSIQRIILTSSSGPVSALRWFRLYLEKEKITHVVPKSTKPIRFQINAHGRSVQVFVLYSPSPRAANKVAPELRTAMYKNVITGNYD